MNTLKRATISERQYVLLLGGILLATFLIYLPSLHNAFTNWDDDKYVLESELIRQFSFKTLFQSFSVGLYTPITNLSYAIDYQFFGNNPWGFHFSALCWHLVCTLLAIVFIKKYSNNNIVALLVGLLFALHPSHVEAVAWISSRKDLLYCAFSLLSLIFYLDFSSSRKRGFYLASCLALLLACLSKPTALGLPLAFIALDYVKGKKIHFLLVEKIPFFLISAAFFAIGLYGLKTLNIPIHPEKGYNLWQILCMASYGFVFYFYKALFPIRLCNFHVYPFPNKDIPTEYLLAPFMLALLVFLFVKYRKKIPGLDFGLVMFFVLLLPTYRIYPAGYPIVAERYFYLSSIGLFFIAASFVHQHLYSKSGVLNPATVVVGTLLAVMMCFATFARSKVWKNSLSLWNNAIKTYPTLYYAYEQRGKYFLSIGDKQLAIADFQKSLSLQPHNPQLINTTSSLLYEQGDTLTAKKYLDQTLKEDASNYVFFYNRANILKAEGKYAEAMKDYNQCLKLNPNLAQGYNNRGVAKIFTGDTVGAFQDFSKASTLNPNDKMFLDNLLRAKKLLGE